MRKFYNKGIGIAALMAGIFIQGGGLSASASPYVLAERQAVTSSELDAMRGGFVTDGGLQLSLGITSAVLVGGVLETISSLNIPNLPNLSSIVNSALKNITTPALSSVSSTSALASGSNIPSLQNDSNYVIQNSTPQQLIQHETIVNLTTNSASIFRQLNFMTNVQQQFINMLH